MNITQSPCVATVSTTDIDDLGSRIVGMAGRLSAAMCRWLLLIAEFDACDGAAKFGLASTSGWLSHACGLSRRTAIDHVRVARALAAFPALVESMSAGRISYSHARAISRVARAGEDQLVGDLIMVAEHGTVGQLEIMVRGLRTVEDNERGPAPAEEYAAWSWSSESQWRLSARLDPERGAMVQKTVETIARTEGISHADALVRMADIAFAAVNDHETPLRELRGDEHAAVVIHLDADLIPAEDPEETEPRSAERTQPTRSAERTPQRPYARIANGPGLPDRVIKRLLCSGQIHTVIHEHGNVRDLGRSHRVVTDRLFRALLIRDHGRCAHPGCDTTRSLQAHHIRQWLHGGRTDLHNLLLLCQAHHLAHHDGEYTITKLRGGRFRFTRTDGTDLPVHINPADHITTDQPIDTEHPDVADNAATTKWDGQHLDRHYAVSVLAQRRVSQKVRAAGTEEISPAV